MVQPDSFASSSTITAACFAVGAGGPKCLPYDSDGLNRIRLAWRYSMSASLFKCMRSLVAKSICESTSKSALITCKSLIVGLRALEITDCKPCCTALIFANRFLQMHLVNARGTGGLRSTASLSLKVAATLDCIRRQGSSSNTRASVNIRGLGIGDFLQGWFVLVVAAVRCY